MELFEKVSKDIVAAMKAKDKVTLEALRNIKKVFIEAMTLQHSRYCRNSQSKGMILPNYTHSKIAPTLLRQRWHR